MDSRLFFLTLFVVGIASSTYGQQSALKYKSQPENVTYDISITVDSPAEKSTYRGRISYAVKGSGNDLALTFNGGLKESTQKKRSSRPGGPFGNPFGGGFAPPPIPGSPFAQSQKPGSLRQTTANISMTPTGRIVSLQGDSQTPLPLGHLSLLVFEALPQEAKTSWQVNSGIQLSEGGEPARGVPGSPFAQRAKPEKHSAGSESATFTIRNTSGSEVTIDKKYRLDSPNTEPAFELGGGGPMVFDRNLGLFISSNLKYDIKVKVKNGEVRIPVTVETKLMTAEEIAAADKQAKDKATMAANNKIAKAKAAFAGKSDQEIAALYRDGELVPPTERTITPQMRLPAGLIIQNKWPYDFKWTPVKVLRELPDGKIEFESVRNKKVYQRDRKTLFLAPDFIDQPFVSRTELAAFRKQLSGGAPSTVTDTTYRTWQDRSGKFAVEAEYVATEGGMVVLRRKKDQKEITVPLQRLSQADQEFLASEDSNPFE